MEDMKKGGDHTNHGMRPTTSKKEIIIQVCIYHLNF